MAFAQETKCLVALQPADVRIGMVAYARQQFQAVRQFHHVIIGADGKAVGLQFRVILGRQHDHRHMRERRVFAVQLDQREAVDARQHQVLQDDGRLQAQRRVQRLRGVGHVMKLDILLVAQHAPDCLSNDQLVVHQQHADLEFGQCGLLQGETGGKFWHCILFRG